MAEEKTTTAGEHARLFFNSLSRAVTIEIRDVRVDGFPEGECYFWSSWGLLHGWPILPDTTKARENPDVVEWQAGEAEGIFIGIWYWVPADVLEKAFKP